MLGQSVRTRVAQSGVVATGATEVNLVGGTAVAGHKLFATGYNPNSLASQSITNVPVLIEKADGSWQAQIMSFYIYNSTGPVSKFMGLALAGSVYESSHADNSALTFADGDTLTITVAPIAALFNGISIQPDSPSDAPAVTVGQVNQTAYPALCGLLAVGHGSKAGAAGAIAIGHKLNANSPYAFITGFGDFSHNYVNEGVSHGLMPGGAADAFGDGLQYCFPVVQRTARIATTLNATPTKMKFVTPEGTTVDHLQVDAGTTSYKARVVATDTTGLNKVWELDFVGFGPKDYSSDPVTKYSPTPVVIYQDGTGGSGASSWGCQFALGSGATAGQLGIYCTGGAGQHVSWVACIDVIATMLQNV